MTDQEKLEIIESHFYPEAQAYNLAGQTLRSCLDGTERMKAVAERVSRLENCEALLDAYIDIAVEAGVWATSSFEASA